MNFTSDEKFLMAMALGCIAVAAIYELVEAIYSTRVIVLPNEPKRVAGKVIEA